VVQLREIEPQLKNLNVQLLAISPDQPSKLKETIDKHNMGFRLLSDSDMVAARSFRVAYKLDDQTLAEFKKYNYRCGRSFRAKAPHAACSSSISGDDEWFDSV
jgi:hypothetical protein